MSIPLSIGQCATLACLLEVSAPKPGNVHRGADFEDCTLNDFLASAVAIGPIMENANRASLGQTILSAIQSTRDVTSANTNLGIVLLLGPLAAVPIGECLETGVQEILVGLTPDDSRNVYEAIRLANPGGINPEGEAVTEMNTSETPPNDLLAAMNTAAHRDMIARQYAENFRDVFQFVVPQLCNHQNASIPDRIVATHLELMREFPDSLIQRKCGIQIAKESSMRAAQVLSSGPLGSEIYNSALADFDFWLRCDGNRRNPGTTADLIAAGLFVALRNGLISPPF